MAAASAVWNLKLSLALGAISEVAGNFGSFKRVKLSSYGYYELAPAVVVPFTQVPDSNLYCVVLSTASDWSSQLYLRIEVDERAFGKNVTGVRRKYGQFQCPAR